MIDKSVRLPLTSSSIDHLQDAFDHKIKNGYPDQHALYQYTALPEKKRTANSLY